MQHVCYVFGIRLNTAGAAAGKLTKQNTRGTRFVEMRSQEGLMGLAMLQQSLIAGGETVS